MRYRRLHKAWCITRAESAPAVFLGMLVGQALMGAAVGLRTGRWGFLLGGVFFAAVLFIMSLYRAMRDWYVCPYCDLAVQSNSPAVLETSRLQHQLSHAGRN